MVKLGTTIIALGLYLVLCGVNLAVNRPRIEKDLTTRTTNSLKAIFPGDQMPVRNVAFSGREGIITIRGTEPALRQQVAKTAARVWGVRTAKVISLPERAPAMRATDIGGKIAITGDLPKGPAQAKLVSAAGVVFGVANVHGDFRISEDVASPAYLDRLSPTLSLLAAVGDGGELQLKEKELILSGTVADETARATIEGTAHELVPPELQFTNQVRIVPRQTAAAPTPAPTVAPTPEPHTDVVIPKEAIPAPEPVKKAKPHAARAKARSPLAGRRLHFYFDSVRMVPDSLPQMPELIEILKKLQGKKIRIIGFCDAIGTARYNQRLSRRRARAVMKALIENGLSADTFMAEGHGASEFIGDNSTEAGRALNRRVEFQVLAG